MWKAKNNSTLQLLDQQVPSHFTSGDTLFPLCSASLKYLFFSHLAKHLFFWLRNPCEKNECPLILKCVNEASITLFSGYSIYADTKSALVEYKLFMKTVSFALNNALLLITLSQNSWTALRSPLWNSKKKITWLRQDFWLRQGCI